MNYNILNYLIGEGFKNVLKNKKSTFAALIIMFVTMITVGICIACVENITSIMSQLEKNIPITVYVKDGVDQDTLTEMEAAIRKIASVNDVTFISKSEALANAKEKLADSAELLDNYTEENHPFPASYSINLTNIEDTDSVVDVLNNTEVIKNNMAEISTSNSTIDGLKKVDKGIRLFCIGLGALLIVVSVVIISNTIKLTVHARRREISIMKYVGATNNFIRAPFVVEGIVIGVVSIAISLLALGGLYHLVYNIGSAAISNNFGYKLLQFSDVFQVVLIIYLVLGLGIGVLGSMLSMKKYLKV